MSYQVTCECGRRHTVKASQAGSSFPCSCGQSVSVPLMSQLRQSAGEERIRRSPIERVQALINEGKLPSNDDCPLTGQPADRTVVLRVVCEQTWIRGESKNWVTLVLALLFGWLGVLMAIFGPSRPREVLGRDTQLDVPLRVSGEGEEQLRNTSRQQVFQKALEDTPAYRDLLQEYPEAWACFIGPE